MNSRIGAHESFHLSGDSATHPIEQRREALAALLLLVGIS